MTKKNSELYNQLTDKSDEDLLSYITSKSSDFTDEALSIIEKILFNRGYTQKDMDLFLRGELTFAEQAPDAKPKEPPLNKKEKTAGSINVKNKPKSSNRINRVTLSGENFNKFFTIRILLVLAFIVSSSLYLSNVRNHQATYLIPLGGVYLVFFIAFLLYERFGTKKEFIVKSGLSLELRNVITNILILFWGVVSTILFYSIDFHWRYKIFETPEGFITVLALLLSPITYVILLMTLKWSTKDISTVGIFMIASGIEEISAIYIISEGDIGYGEWLGSQLISTILLIIIGITLFIIDMKVVSVDEKEKENLN